MPWYFYIALGCLAVVGLSVNPMTIYLMQRWLRPETEGEPIFDDGDFMLRKMPDGSIKGEWSNS